MAELLWQQGCGSNALAAMLWQHAGLILIDVDMLVLAKCTSMVFWACIVLVFWESKVENPY